MNDHQLCVWYTWRCRSRARRRRQENQMTAATAVRPHWHFGQPVLSETGSHVSSTLSTVHTTHDMRRRRGVDTRRPEHRSQRRERRLAETSLLEDTNVTRDQHRTRRLPHIIVFDAIKNPESYYRTVINFKLCTARPFAFRPQAYSISMRLYLGGENRVMAHG